MERSFFSIWALFAIGTLCLIATAAPPKHDVSLWKLADDGIVLSPDKTLKHLGRLDKDSDVKDLLELDHTDDCAYLEKYKNSKEVRIKGMKSRSVEDYVTDRLRRLKVNCSRRKLEYSFLERIKQHGSSLDDKTIAKIDEFRKKALEQIKIPSDISLTQLTRHIASYYADEANDCWTQRSILHKTPLGCGKRTQAACENLRHLLNPLATNVILLTDGLVVENEEEIKWLHSYILCNAALGTLRCTPVPKLPKCEVFKFDI